MGATYCGELVPHTGFEPVISALRGRCPRPLDECGTDLGSGPSLARAPKPMQTDYRLLDAASPPAAAMAWRRSSSHPRTLAATSGQVCSPITRPKCDADGKYS